MLEDLIEVPRVQVEVTSHADHSHLRVTGIISHQRGRRGARSSRQARDHHGLWHQFNVPLRQLIQVITPMIFFALSCYELKLSVDYGVRKGGCWMLK